MTMIPSIQRLNAIGLLASGLLLTSVSGVQASSEELDRLFGLGPAETFTLQSETLDRDFFIYVRKPGDYDETECDWPVVYILDGGVLFPMLAPYHFMLEIDELASPAVLVGISYGGLGFANGNYRSTDYTAPASDPEYYGGASAYQDFLANELIPRISRDYRVDHANSLVLGQSLGGQFTLYTALTRPELFAAYLSINPALHRNVDYFIDLQPKGREVRAPILITRGAEERPSFSEPLERWLTAWSAADSDALALTVKTLADQHHASSAPEAYRHAMQWWTPGGCENLSDDEPASGLP